MSVLRKQFKQTNGLKFLVSNFAISTSKTDNWPRNYKVNKVNREMHFDSLIASDFCTFHVFASDWSTIINPASTLDLTSP